MSAMVGVPASRLFLRCLYYQAIGMAYGSVLMPAFRVSSRQCWPWCVLDGIKYQVPNPGMGYLWYDGSISRFGRVSSLSSMLLLHFIISTVWLMGSGRLRVLQNWISLLHANYSYDLLLLRMDVVVGCDTLAHACLPSVQFL
jgi:hypothetical protein